MTAANMCPEVTPAVLEVLADQLVDAMRSPGRSHLVALERTFGDGFLAKLREAPKSVVDAVTQRAAPDCDLALLYRLGQLSFALQIAEQALKRLDSTEQGEPRPGPATA